MAIHSLLSRNEYRVTADSGIAIDADTGMIRRMRDVVYRGTLAGLFDTFKFGEQAEVPDGSQSRLYCAGPQSARQIDGTYSDPHWTATIEHVGLHSYVHGGSTSVFRATPGWTTREVTLPIEYPGDPNPVIFYAGLVGGFLPTGANPYAPCTITDHIPGWSCRGVMVTAMSPHPLHPAITGLIATLGPPNTTSMIDYGGNPGAGYNFAHGMPVGTPTSGKTEGVWLVGDISAERVISPLVGSALGGVKIWTVEFPLRWLQRKLPV